MRWTSTRSRHDGSPTESLTPKPTRKVETLTRVSPTSPSCHEEDTVLRKWSWSRYCSTNCILVTKTQVGITTTKAPDPRTTNRHTKPKPSPGLLRPLSHFEKKTLSWGSVHCHGTVPWTTFLKLKQKSEGLDRKFQSHVPTRKSMRHQPDPNHTPTHPTRKPPSINPSSSLGSTSSSILSFTESNFCSQTETGTLFWLLWINKARAFCLLFRDRGPDPVVSPA